MVGVDVQRAIRRWRTWSTGNVDELAAVTTAFAWSLGLKPRPETTASDQISRRTIRYYVSSGLLSPPEGQTRTASYDYRHLLQLLYIKARQHQGHRLDDIQSGINGDDGETLESHLFALLPEAVAPPLPSDPEEFARSEERPMALRRWAYLTGNSGRWGSAPTTPRDALIASDGVSDAHPDGFNEIAHRPRVTDAKTSRAGARSWQEVVAAEGLSDQTTPGGTRANHQPRNRLHIPIEDDMELIMPAIHPLAVDDDGRDHIVRSVRRLIRDYLHGGGGPGRGRQ